VGAVKGDSIDIFLDFAGPQLGIGMIIGLSVFQSKNKNILSMAIGKREKIL